MVKQNTEEASTNNLVLLDSDYARVAMYRIPQTPLVLSVPPQTFTATFNVYTLSDQHYTFFQSVLLLLIPEHCPVDWRAHVEPNHRDGTWKETEGSRREQGEKTKDRTWEGLLPSLICNSNL